MVSQVQDRPRNVNVTEYEKFTDMVLDSSWQLTFTLVKFEYSINEEYARLPAKAIKSLPFSYYISVRLDFLHMLTVLILKQHHNRVSAEANMRFSLSSIKIDIQEIGKK